MLSTQIKRFLLVGTVNTLFYYIIYSSILYLGADYKLSVLLATILGIFFSFKMLGRFVFFNTKSVLIYRFILVYFFIFLLNIVLIYFFNMLFLNYYISGFFAALCCAIFSFILNKYFIFSSNMSP